MRKLLILSFFGFCSFLASAQPQLVFEDLTVDPGDNFCVPVRGNFFTNIVTLEFSIAFDPNLLTFQGVNSFGIASMSAANIDLSNVSQGIISVNWKHPTFKCTDLPDDFRTLDNGAVLFNLCFTASSTATYGQVARIELAGPPYPIVVERARSFNPTFGCTNLGFLEPFDTGLVSFQVRPFKIFASNEQGNEGDLICVDFRVTGFDNMRSMQFTVNWDPDIMQIQSVIPNEDIPNNGSGAYGFSGGVPPGSLTVSWSYFIPGQPGISLTDSTLFFQACFRIKAGTCDSGTAVDFGNVPTPFEVTNDVVEGFNIFSESGAGAVTVNDCDPTGLQLVADCGGPVNINDEVCVKIKAGSNYQSVTDLQFLLEWNPSILEFKQVRNLSSSWTMGDFDSANKGNGVLGVNWDNNPLPAQTLANGATVFEVCFTVIGLGGNSPITFSSPPEVAMINNGPNIGINPTNCEVAVIQPPGVAMNFGTAQAAPGEEACLDVTVSNFEDIVEYRFSLAWDATLFQFGSIRNVNIPGATLADFNTAAAGSGAVFFNWSATGVNGVSLPDETVIFQMCFQPIGDPLDCDMLEMIDFPLVSEAISATSNGEDVGIIANTGEICTLFPEGFGLSIDKVEGDWLDTTCVQLRVLDFDNITKSQFCLNWDPTALQFVGFNNPGSWPGLTNAGIIDASADVGVLCVDWLSGSAVAIPDSTVVLELCFALVGDANACYEVAVSDDPASLVETSNGNGSLISKPGEVCIKDRFIITDTLIVPESCPGACDGKIELTVIGGQGFIGTTWLTEPQNRFTPLMTENLCAGPISFRLFDSNAPVNLVQEFTLEIPLSDDLPMAEAGLDKTINCNPPSVLLSGMGSTGTDYEYQWFDLAANGQKVPIGSKQNPVVTTSPGRKVLEVTNKITGCTIADTMRVQPAILPAADAGPDLSLTCVNDTLRLGGPGSSIGDTITYQWRSLNGGTILPGDEQLPITRVTAPGQYELAVRITVTGCEVLDTVNVLEGRIFPQANAGEDLVLDCSGVPALLDGSASDNFGLEVTYEWFDNTGKVGDGITFGATQLGTYTLIATESTSGCTAADEVMVTPDENYPEIVFAPNDTFNCNISEVMLSASVNPSNINFTFQWSAQNGGQLAPGTETTLTPTALAPGIYVLSLTNTDNNCTAVQELVVPIDTIAPVAEAGLPLSLTCADPVATLDGTGSSAGPDFAYLWLNETGDTIAQNTLSPEVDAPGKYCLTVSNLKTGCSSVDCVDIPLEGNPPAVSINGASELTCQVSSLELTASATPAGGDYTVEWFLLDGNGGMTPVGGSMLNLSVDRPGTYQVVVTNNADGCPGMAEVSVTENKELPTAEAGPAQVSISCDNPSIVLSSEGSSAGTEFSYQWSGNVQATTLEVNEAGLYYLTVTNTLTNCIAVDSVTVAADTLAPMVSIDAPMAITCTDPQVSLNGRVEGAANFTASWTGSSGQPTPADQVATTATLAGTYTLLVENTDNGCTAEATVEVISNDTLPEIRFEPPAAFSCQAPTATIDASATGNPASFRSITWSAPGGNVVTPATGSLIVEVNGPGTYQLTVERADNGCEATQTIVVEADNDTPTASAGDDFEIGCGETGNLDGNASSQGAAFTYQWTNIEGGSAPTPSNVINPEITAAGTYRLLVTNTENGCTSTDEVMVSLDLPPDADAGSDQSTCENTANLVANLPAGTTGVWASLDGAQLSATDQAQVGASALIGGPNRFVWTLSAPGCENYSSSTVTVFREAAPIANNDVLTITAEKRNGSVNLAANDILTNISQWTIKLLSQPELGNVDTLRNGVLSFSVGRGVFGVTTITYEICNQACPDLCATASVRIEIQDDGFKPELPNTITPNGDGLNDALVFDDLLNRPAEDFPDNELIIFNRWGDIVFRQKPYDNDWRGTNDTGEDLPQGTYYYILRLNISNGEIIRGDITIVK